MEVRSAKSSDFVNDILSIPPGSNFLLTGGNTARFIYNEWANHAGIMQSLSRMTLFFSDERWVDYESNDNNYRMFLRAVASSPFSQRLRVIPIESGGADIFMACKNYEARLPNEFDLGFLTLGNDGHIASLFNNEHSVFVSESRVVSLKSSVLPYARISLTPQALNSVRKLYIYANTMEKRLAFTRIFQTEDAGIDYAVRRLNNPFWIFHD